MLKSIKFAKIMPRQSIYSAIAAVILLQACTSAPDYKVFSGFAQGGNYRVSVDMGPVRASGKEVGRTIDAILDSIDISLSGYNGNSLVSRFNAGEKIVPDRHFTAIKALSDKYKALTDGAFDVGAAPLYDIWGFGFTTDSLPSDDALERAMLECAKGTRINFNAIAQGYTCDVIRDYLHSIGATDFLVDIGEIYCEGRNPKGSGWTVGIDTPVDGNNSPGAMLSGIWMSDPDGGCGIVTSGNYRKYYVRDGRKYAHTIDPRSGRPVTHSLLSATIVAADAAEADALATACMVMGPEAARDFILANEGIEGYLISADSSWCSPGFNLRKN